MSIYAKLKSMDFYRRIPRDLTEASMTGASLSLAAAVIMVALFFLELNSFLSIQTDMLIVTDQSHNGELLRVNFNFSFPSLSCEFAAVDVVDVIGTTRKNLTKTVQKYPIDHSLKVIGPEHHPDPVPIPKNKGDDSNETVEEVHAKAAAEGHDYVGSLVLGPDNFDHYTNEHDILFVNFFAPWCPWCQRLEPAWEKAATTMNHRYHPDYDGRIRLAKIDCTIHQELCRRHHIQGFPSLRIFRKGHDQVEHSNHMGHDHESYYGERDADSLIKFAESLVPQGTISPHSARALPDSHQHVKRKAPASGGCNIAGFVLVKKVPGSLIVRAQSDAHSFDASTMNLTHHINSLRFGRVLSHRNQLAVNRLTYVPELKKYYTVANQRLEDHNFVSHHDNVTHEHFMQIVLTEVKPLASLSSRRPAIYAYDYTAQSHTMQMPSVPVARFHYEPSPMQVLIVEKGQPFFHFITNLCAIIGGVFTVAGILEGMFQGAVRMVKKNTLGKQF